MNGGNGCRYIFAGRNYCFKLFTLCLRTVTKLSRCCWLIYAIIVRSLYQNAIQMIAVASK